ncbi:hypothetical protein NVP2275O_423 [Vibrio phage 2.275.O._10N.286.54.E11]|nr:hypothetical protein NVP2275O_423 [Vibrio phage 2.275.O._10N.286.54.E11]
MNLNEKPMMIFKGHVKIIDFDTKEVLVEDSNDIHPENMSYAIAQSIAGNQAGVITTMRFGNGGTSIVQAQDLINYKRPNTTGLAELYNETYAKIINNEVDPSVDDSYNSVRAVHISGQVFSDIVCTCTLGLNEPSDAATNDRTQQLGIEEIDRDQYLFDELGLYDNEGKHLTHIIFHPVQKSKNRVLQVIYTVRAQLV